MKLTESTIKLASGLILGYALLSPVKAKSMALVFFHGQGEFPRGVDYSHQALKAHGPLKFASKLDWLPYYVIHLQGQRDKYNFNANQCDEAIGLIYKKHSLDIKETQLSGLSQGGQACGDLIKLKPENYNIYSSFSGVCTLLWSGFSKLLKGLYVFGDPKDGVMNGTKELIAACKLDGVPLSENWYPGIGHGGWGNLNTAYGNTNENDLNSIYNWHAKQSKVLDLSTPEVPAPVIIEPEIPVDKPLAPGILPLKRERFSCPEGVNIDKIVDAILKGEEYPINYQNQKPYTIIYDLELERTVVKVEVKDGQGINTDPTNFKTDKGEQIGLFYGKQYNMWYELPLKNFKTRYIRIENVQETKKNLPIGLEITVLQ